MPKLNVLIVDYTTHHPEVVETLRCIFAEHHVRLVVTSSFASKYAEDLTLNSDLTIVKPKKLALREWMAQLAPVMAIQDIVIFSTALRDRLLMESLKLRARGKKVVFIHNTHYFTERFPVDTKSYAAVFGRTLTSLSAWKHYASMRFKFFRRKIKDYRNGTQFSKFVSEIDFFCFGSEQLATYFNGLTGYDNALVLPMCSSSTESLPRPAHGEVLRIGIVGLVSPERRNYLEIIRELGRAKYSARVELHILGRCPDRSYGRKIGALIAEVSSGQFSVVFDADSRFVPAEELRQRLLQIHLLLSPIRLDFSFHFYHEIYGVTKISGAEADCIHFNRLVMLPKNYSYSKNIAPFVLTYDGIEDLTRLIDDITRPEEWERLDTLLQSAEPDNANCQFLSRFFQRLEDGASAGNE